MFHCSVNGQSYAEIYESCFGFKILENPDLPNRICNDCESKLIEMNSFRETVQEIEWKISEFLASKSTEVLTITKNNEAESSVEEEFTSENIDSGEFLLDETEDMTVEIKNIEEFIEEVDSSNQSAESPSCEFVPSNDNPQEIECKTCLEGCDFQQKINNLRPENNIPIICECKKVLKNRRSFLKHFSTVHRPRGTKYNCRVCGEIFTSPRSRTVHEVKIHNFAMKFTCEKCDKKFYRSDHLKEHEKSCNRDGDVSSKFFSCFVCLLPFQREETYNKHLETAHIGAGEDDQECLRRVEEFGRKYTGKRSVDESCELQDVHCDQCGKIFTNETRLQRHIKTFHTKQTWSCDQCGEKFVHRSTKLSHMSKVHGMQKAFECSVIGCSFSSFKSDRFRAHMEKHDNPDKMFPCPICQEEFKSYNTMTIHRARHQTKNTLECPICSKQFLDRRNYNMHLKSHRNEKLFHCPSCNQGFNRKDHLKRHQSRKKHI